MKLSDKPNIILIMTDQYRADCLSAAGHPAVQTPCLDHLAARGNHFTQAYSACPVCIPARRTLMTGQRPATHGVLGNYETWLEGKTLPQMLRDAGYQTHLSGKLHLWPLRCHYGFDEMDLSDGPGASREEGDSDYIRYLRRNGLSGYEQQVAHGMQGESCRVRTWHMDERHHVCNWATDMAINFIERRDQTRPFFLKLSYFNPHPPITPPQFYYERYMNMDIPMPQVGEWARMFDSAQYGRPNQSPRQCLTEELMKQYRAAYYAEVNHIDDQLQRFMNFAEITPHVDMDNTMIIFTSDHGDMLGDNQWHRKSCAYQGSVHIPFLIKLPETMGIEQGRSCDAPVELMDLMPTVLDVAGIDIPQSVDGCSLLPLMRGEKIRRDYIHGEINEAAEAGSGMHYLTDGKTKYVWYPALAKEELFDICNDPYELHELSAQAEYSDVISSWREKLIDELESRPEGFVRDGELQKLSGPTSIFLPGHERPDNCFTEGIR